MKKQEMKELVSEWNREISCKDISKVGAYERLVQLNASYGDGHKWCSLYKNLIGVLSNSTTSDDVKERAVDLFASYCNFEGMLYALIKFQELTNNFDL